MSDRKYRQQGYMDDGQREQKGSRSKQPERKEGPRGRGLGAPSEEVFRCAACGHKRSVMGPVEVTVVCAHCGADLHSCSNCTWFDTSQPNECRKPVPARIKSKTKRNDCELFEPKLAKEFGSSDSGGKPDDPRAAFDALFKI
jgi:ribosomal protein S27E